VNRKDAAQFKRKHRRWPLGLRVAVKTRVGYIEGRVFKHWRLAEVPHGCSVIFDTPYDLTGCGYKTFAHILPFRSLRPIDRPAEEA
jgi:hypothetical protein